jgi:anti-sigma factor RsiW
MKCKIIHKKLIFFIEGELPQNEMKEIALHLNKCTECAAFADELRKTLAAAEREKNIQVSPYFFNRLKARMENQPEAPSPVHEFPVWERLLQPAVFSVLLLAGIYTGIKVGARATGELPASGYAEMEIIPFINELEAEPLEMFLME